MPPSSLTGRVHLDPNQNCLFDAGEQPLAGVVIRLFDSSGQVLAETTTDAAGRYRFDQLRPGQYAVQEIQPRGYFHGGQRAGSHGGNVSVADVISEVQVPAGQALTDYDFCELPPSSLEGVVHLDPDQDCQFDAGEQPLAGVAIRLLDSSGRVVAETTTDADGRYRFDQLRPGQYAVQEIQPREYFHGGQRVGSHGGNASSADLISGIQVPAGQALTDYDFCELPAARLSGYVFQDGELIRTLDGLPPSDIWQKHDGRRTPDDRPLAGVVLELRDAQTGLPVSSDRALPGTYQSGVITALTDVARLLRVSRPAARHVRRDRDPAGPLAGRPGHARQHRGHGFQSQFGRRSSTPRRTQRLSPVGRDRFHSAGRRRPFAGKQLQRGRFGIAW